MNFRKCLRRGCFFSSVDDICPNFAPKDNFFMSKLKTFLTNQVEDASVADISKGTGIDESNINRFMNNKDFIKAVKKEKNNIDINL
mgnify:FL=1